PPSLPPSLPSFCPRTNLAFDSTTCWLLAPTYLPTYLPQPKTKEAKSYDRIMDAFAEAGVLGREGGREGGSFGRKSCYWNLDAHDPLLFYPPSLPPFLPSSNPPFLPPSLPPSRCGRRLLAPRHCGPVRQRPEDAGDERGALAREGGRKGGREGDGMDRWRYTREDVGGRKEGREGRKGGRRCRRNRRRKVPPEGRSSRFPPSHPPSLPSLGPAPSGFASVEDWSEGGRGREREPVNRKQRIEVTDAELLLSFSSLLFRSLVFHFFSLALNTDGCF
ncbi:hypothetical protein Naga_101999g1, partial [Nannochloropsis gaditana]